MEDNDNGKEELIYEVLHNGDCLIISKGAEGLLVAANEGGAVVLKRVKEEQRIN